VIDMLSVSTLIDFLMNLMRDEDAKEAFDQDPQGTLTRHGLDDVSGQDVRDARLIMADNGGVRPRPDHESRSGSRHDDPVREIHHTTNNYVINEGPSIGSVDQTFNEINIEDNDTTVVDSFNSADTTDVDVVAVQDNDVTNIDVTDIDIEDSFNEEPAAGEPGGEEPGAGTDPADGTPGGEPADSAPPGGEPADSTLGDELIDSEPAGSATLDSEPVDSEPVDSGPVDSEPVDSGPVGGTDPVDSEPLGDEPDLDAAVI
jgi:hypothetical protein